MNILFLSQIIPYPPHGGVLQRGFNIIRELSKYNRIHLLAYIHPETLQPPFSLEESRQVLGKFCESLEYSTLWPKRSRQHRYTALAAGLLSGEPFSVVAHRSREFRKNMASVLDREDIDLIHFDTIALSQYLLEGTDIPQVLTHHNIESSLMKRRSEQEVNLLRRLYVSKDASKLERYEKRECPRFDMNITVSEVDASLLQDRLPGLRTRVVPNGVDVDYFKAVETDMGEKPSLIYTGGMNMFANCDAVLYFLEEIWPLIRKQVPEVQFFAVGQDPPSKLISYSKGDKNIHVTGFVDDVRPLINDASVYVVPLRVGGGTRLKVLDAMAMGKAMVSTSLGCEGIQVTDGKNILIRDEPASFAQSTITLLNEHSLRAKIGLEARNLVEQKYSWEGIGSTLQGVYEELARSRQGII